MQAPAATTKAILSVFVMLGGGLRILLIVKERMIYVFVGQVVRKADVVAMVRTT